MCIIHVTLPVIKIRQSERELALRDEVTVGSMEKHGWKALRDSMDRLTVSQTNHVPVNTCYKYGDSVPPSN